MTDILVCDNIHKNRINKSKVSKNHQK